MIGRLVATRRYAGLEGVALQLIQPLDEHGEPMGDTLVAAAVVSTGPGDLVHFVDGREGALACPETFVPVDAAFLRAPWARPVILCGQNSLEIFCLGVFLAFAAHFVTVELYGGLLMQVMLSVAGIASMIAVAALLSWYKVVEGRGGPPKRPPDADLAGGSA